MRRLFFIILFFTFSIVKAQEENPVKAGSNLEQQLENLSEQMDSEPEDDYYLQTLVHYRKYPLNLNTAAESELRELRLLTEIQIQNLIKYKNQLGFLISIYELQSIPGWDVDVIKRLLPYVRVGSAVPVTTELLDRLKGGQHSILLRMQQLMEKSNGYLRPESEGNRYQGSRQRAFFRYKYNNRNLLQFGIAGEKDPGEQFLRGKQKSGFDFYSFHLFVRKLRWIKMLALGDYTVNLGQGLIHWQSLAFKKSAEVTAVKRQADVLRPYNSAGEFNFLRGAGVTIGTGDFSITTFASYKKIDGSLNADSSQLVEPYTSSISNTGYHRTANEIFRKNTLNLTTVGGNISYYKRNLNLSLNGIRHSFSIPLIRNPELYNQYAIQGTSWHNYSFNYSYTFKNAHLFGEAALDKNNSRAFISGLIASIHPLVDVSFVYRNIQKSYQALFGNAFTETSLPTNEKGTFTGVSVKLRPTLKLNMYADIFSFPWLRFRVDAPSTGTEYLIQLNYSPAKKFETYVRFRNENKVSNILGLNMPTRQPYLRVKQNLRTQASFNYNRELSIRGRLEFMILDSHDNVRKQNGLLTYVEGSFKPSNKKVSVNLRTQYFNTSGYESRIYALERDVLYSYSIPQFIGKGFRYYININYDFSKYTTIWFRWAQTLYSNETSIGSGLDEIIGNKRSEIKLQLLHNF